MKYRSLLVTRRNVGAVVVLLALATTLTGALFFLQGDSSARMVMSDKLIVDGLSAPEFELPASDGTTASLEAYEGGSVLLFFNMGSG